MLVPSHECWSHPTGAGPIPWVLAPHQGRWSSYQGTSSRVLGVLEEGEDPPLQHRPGGAPVLPGEQRRGHPGGQYSPCPLRPPPQHSLLQWWGTLGFAYRSRFPLSTVLVRLSTPAFSRLLNWKTKQGGGVRLAPCLSWCRGLGRFGCPSPGCSPSPP